MITKVKYKSFANGAVYLLNTEDKYPIEVTDTFLPYYTKDSIGRRQNKLVSEDLGSREDRWMIGVSCMSGCPVGCKFCATGNLKKCKNLSVRDIVDQVEFVLSRNDEIFSMSKEYKINYTRMGEPFLNIDSVKGAIKAIDSKYPETHHYISTIGIKGSDFSFVKDNVTLQISLHSLDTSRRDWLIPYKNKMSIEELGQIRTESNYKTTVNLTLVDTSDFDIEELKRYFDPEYFFVKLSPINVNECSENYNLGSGIIEGNNLI